MSISTANWTIAYGLLDKAKYLNEISNGIAWTYILVGWAIILFTVLSLYDNKKALSVSSMSTTILAILFFSVGLITGWALAIFIIITALMYALLFFT